MVGEDADTRGARDQETRGGKRGRCLCLSYCSPVSPGLSVSQCLRTQSAPIPTVSHLLRLLFLATTESYSATVKYIALLSPSFSSERPPPPWQRERWKLTDFNLWREGRVVDRKLKVHVGVWQEGSIDGRMGRFASLQFAKPQSAYCKPHRGRGDGTAVM